MLRVHVAFTFEGIHCWPNAKEPYEELQYPHRHKFRVEVSLEVKHRDREVEFYALRDLLRKHFSPSGSWPLWGAKWIEFTGFVCNLGEDSCEDVAKHVADFLCKKYPGRSGSVKVSEDEDFGASFLWE